MRWELLGLAVVSVSLASGEGGAPAKVTTKVNPVGGETYVWIPAGTFAMGCSAGDADWLYSTGRNVQRTSERR